MIIYWMIQLNKRKDPDAKEIISGPGGPKSYRIFGSGFGTRVKRVNTYKMAKVKEKCVHKEYIDEPYCEREGGWGVVSHQNVSAWGGGVVSHQNMSPWGGGVVFTPKYEPPHEDSVLTV
jgi:hypothetical protein